MDERIYKYRPDCGLIVSARGTPQHPRDIPVFSRVKEPFNPGPASRTDCGENPIQLIVLAFSGLGRISDFTAIFWEKVLRTDENERFYRYRLDCGLIVSARGTPQPSENPPHDFHTKVADLRLCCALDHQTTAGTLRHRVSITP